MSKLAEILGVKDDEEWRFGADETIYRVHGGVRQRRDIESGKWQRCDSEEELLAIIRRPKGICRFPKLTEAEIAICKAVGAKFVYMSELRGSPVYLYKDMPSFDKKTWYLGTENEHLVIACVWDTKLFPSLFPGDLVEVPESVDEGR